MANLDSLTRAKKMVEDAKKKYRYDKSNREFARKVELQNDLGKCRAQLEITKTELLQTIRTQSRNIRATKNTQAGTVYDEGKTQLKTVQEQMLWDAAIAYMLVKDAITAIETIASHDSIAHAYEMLDAATTQLSGKKKNGFLKLPLVQAVRSRGAYDFITSEEALEKKEKSLESVFERLKETGDIEGCMAAAKNPGDVDASRAEAYTSGGRVSQREEAEDSLDERIKRVASRETTKVDYKVDMEEETEIHPDENAGTKEAKV